MGNENQHSESKIYFVNWSGNWADEISLNGYSIMSGEDRLEFELAFGGAEHRNDGIGIYVGTNEEIECTKGDYLEDCTFTEITPEQKDMLRKLVKLDENWAPNSVWADVCECEECE